MDKELKQLVKQVESCFTERTTNSEVINVATVLLIKAAIQIVENMPIDKAIKEVESMVSHVLGNMTANVKIALMKKQLRNIASKDPLSAQDLGIFTQILENESHLN